MIRLRYFHSGTYTTRTMDTYQAARAEITRLMAEGFERALIMEPTRSGTWHITFDTASGY